MIMRIPDVGSHYLMGFLDSNGNPYDGAKTYKVTPAQGHSRAGILVVYLMITSHAPCSIRRSATRAPASQSYPSPAAESR